MRIYCTVLNSLACTSRHQSSIKAQQLLSEKTDRDMRTDSVLQIINDQASCNVIISTGYWPKKKKKKNKGVRSGFCSNLRPKGQSFTFSPNPGVYPILPRFIKSETTNHSKLCSQLSYIFIYIFMCIVYFLN